MSEKGEYVPSPRPNPRLRPEGAAYAERNRGTMERWFDYSDTLSSSGKANGTGSGDHAGTQAPWAESERPAVNADGGRSVQATTADDLPAELSDSFIQEGAMQDLMQKSSELSLNNPPGRAEEAKEYAQRNRDSHIINDYKAQYPQHQPLAQDSETAPALYADPNQSSRDSTRQRTLHKESQGSTWDETRPAPRIRPDGESIAMKNSTDSMFGIMRRDQPPSSPQDSPTKAAGPHSSHHSQESATPPQSANQPRARPGEGMKNYERAHDQSEMAAILRGEGDSGRAAAPRNIRHLQRSELW